MPFNENLHEKISPIYETFPGWKESTFGMSDWDELPLYAKKYITYIESFLGIDIPIISTGPERTQTIDRKNLLTNI